MAINTTLVTTFSGKLWEQYGERCLTSWREHLPENIAVAVYDEDGILTEHDIPDHWCLFNPAWYAPYREFMAKHTQQDLRMYRQDARRFAHKVFALDHAATVTDTEYLIWIDADVFCFADVPANFFPALFSGGNYLFYLGRSAYTHSECGCWGMDAQQSHHPSFPSAFANLYSSGQVFRLPEQHDSFCFDWLRKRCEQQGRFTSRNISAAPKGHAWLASPLASYFDHWKGNRWKTQKSWREDVSSLTAQGVRLDLTHPYWRHMPSRIEAV